MYCRNVFVLLSLFVAAVTSQGNSQACIDAQNAVRANQPCFNAVTGVMNAIAQNTSISAGADLNVYCAAGCRNLVTRVFIACDDGDDSLDGNLRLLTLTCVTDAAGMSCAQLLFSPQFAQIRQQFDNESSGVCPFEMSAGQECSSACQTAIQNFANSGGCCVQHLFEFVGDESTNVLVAQCDVDYSRGGVCTELAGGATGKAIGLRAFGSFLLFAIMIAATLI